MMVEKKLKVILGDNKFLLIIINAIIITPYNSHLSRDKKKKTIHLTAQLILKELTID